MSGLTSLPATCRTVTGFSLASPAFVRAEANRGFDQDAHPPWQMIPEGKYREVYFHGGGAQLSDFNFQAYPTDLVTIEYAPYDPRAGLKRGIGLVGSRADTGYVVATQRTNPTCTARLEIAVKTQKTVTVYFQFVSDKVDLAKGKMGASTTRRSMGQIDAILAAANRILTPQTNVKLQESGRKHLLLAEDLGREVLVSRSQSGQLPVWDERDILFRHANQEADFNVFFVRELEDRQKGDMEGATVTIKRQVTITSLSGGAPAYRANCIIEDRLGRDNSMDAGIAGLVLAHEVGHYLMRTYNPNIRANDHHQYHGQGRPSHHLMYSGKYSYGIYIPKDDANKMNPN